MRSTKYIYFIGINSLLVVILLIASFFVPSVNIKLNGKSTININVGEEFNDPGAYATLNVNLRDEKINYKTIGKVDTNKIGKYIVTYKLDKNYGNKSVNRVVNVKDNIPPVINIDGNVNYCKNKNIISYKATVTDNYDGNITDKLEYKIKNNNVTFKVSDSNGNNAKLEKELNYIDNEAPKITLNGDKVTTIFVGDEYIEQGAKAIDSCDGNLTKKITIKSDVDVNTVGNYTVTYTVSDNDGNKTSVTRSVVVYYQIVDEVVTDGRIYLTFDDGPCAYTESILNTLDKYGVKATFFVTSQFPNYIHMIKEEYNRGHAIGIHTYSHKWDIYSSEEEYMNDFNLMESIIFEQTGIHTKIFRFPGGSSNQVSISKSKGIMTLLAEKLQNEGYKYFDWTFDSGDTDKKDNSEEAIIRRVKSGLKGNGDYIILMHDMKKNTMDALDDIIEYGLAKGYKFSVLSENSYTVHQKIAN